MAKENPAAHPIGAASLAGEIMAIAKDNPAAREAGDYATRSLVIVSRTVHNVLLPFAAMNFGIQKAEAYFRERFTGQLAEKTSHTPPQDLTEPKPSIVAPAIQALAFSHDERELRDMYLSLIATAMDGRSPEEAHPAFVEVIRQLSAEEAVHLRSIIRNGSHHPIVEFRAKSPSGSGWESRAKHILNLVRASSRVPEEDLQMPVFVDNWIRLGLVTVDYTTFLTREDVYDWAEARPEYLRAASTLSVGESVEVAHGTLIVSAFGRRFSAAVGMNAEAIDGDDRPS